MAAAPPPSAMCACPPTNCTACKTTSTRRRPRSPPLPHLLLLLLFVVAASAALSLLPSPARVAGGRRLTKSGKSAPKLFESVDVLSETDLAAAINRSSKTGITVTAVIKANIKLTRELPKLKGNGSTFNAVGACVDKANKKKPISRCEIDGSNRYSVFVTGVPNSPCSVSVRGLTFQRVLNGVLQGYCSFTARDCAFNNNRAVGIGGAVLNSGVLAVGWDTPSVPVLIRFCNFTNNTATNADGGAISSFYVSGHAAYQADIAYSTFHANRAINGSGGAIALANYGDTLLLRGVDFVGNYAEKNGGAVRTRGESVHSHSSTFMANTAAKGQGGGLSLDGFVESDALFCNTTFADNRARADDANRDTNGGSRSDNLLFEGDGGSVRLDFCPAIPAAVLGRAHNGEYPYDRDWSRQNCTGCTGCPKDCNGNGKCQLTEDFIPFCKCNEGFDPESACESCLPFRNITTSCTTCFQGFVPGKKGEGCAGCPGLDKIPYVVDIQGYRASYKVSSASSCGAIFNATQGPIGTILHRNVWAYINGSGSKASGAAAKACRDSCVLFDSYLDWNKLPRSICESDRRLHYLPSYGLYYLGSEDEYVVKWSGKCPPRS